MWHFCWLKVAKKHGCAEIHAVFWVGFGVSLGQGCKETWRVQNSCLFWVGFGIFLAHSCKETWHVQNSCLLGCSNFVLWVSFLAGVVD